MQRYTGVISRFLQQDERRIPSNEETLPFVIEANHLKSTHFLQNFVSSNSSKIVHDISEYGAILFRGFDIKTTNEFENIILSIKEMHGISNIFMSFPGRVLVDNQKFVFHTNSLVKTGGGFRLPVWHNENYFIPDVPAYIAFCCFKPSILGGETGLVNMNKLYEALDPVTKETLEKRAFFHWQWSISTIANRYNISVDHATDICIKFGLTIKNKLICLYKPNVFKHPLNKKKAMQANFIALPNLEKFIMKFFMHNYKGWQWAIHRILWNNKKMHDFLTLFFMYLRHPKRFFLHIKKGRVSTQVLNTQNEDSLQKIFNCEKEYENLARLIKEHHSSFIWKTGDILLIDNIQISHAGMPGFGSRKIRALMTNPIKMHYSDYGSGIQEIEMSKSITLGEMFKHNK